MSTALKPDARFFFCLIGAFLLWSALSGPLLRGYARLFGPAARLVLAAAPPRGARVDLAETYPHLVWQTEHPDLPPLENNLSFRLHTYNLILYLALLSALPRIRPAARARTLLPGLAVLFAFHLLDFRLAVESRLLSHLRPENYEFWRHFSPWFLAVKFYHSFSMLALKQLIPFGVIALQWHAHAQTAAAPGATPNAPR